MACRYYVLVRSLVNTIMRTALTKEIFQKLKHMHASLYLL